MSWEDSLPSFLFFLQFFQFFGFSSLSSATGSEGDCDFGPLSIPSLGPFQSPLLCRQKDGNQSPDFGFSFFLSFLYALSRMDPLDKALALCSSRCGLPRSM